MQAHKAVVQACMLAMEQSLEEYGQPLRKNSAKIAAYEAKLVMRDVKERRRVRERLTEGVMRKKKKKRRIKKKEKEEGLPSDKRM